jgi:hypothetical protein
VPVGQPVRSISPGRREPFLPAHAAYWVAISWRGLPAAGPGMSCKARRLVRLPLERAILTGHA